MKNRWIVPVLASALLLSLGGNIYLCRKEKCVQRIPQKNGKTEAVKGLPKMPPEVRKTPPEKSSLFLLETKFKDNKAAFFFSSRRPLRRESAACTVTPALKEKKLLTAQEGMLLVSGVFEPGKTYTFRISKGLADDHGGILEEDVSAQIRIPDRKAEIAFCSSGEVLANLPGRNRLYFRSVNCSAAVVLLEKAYDNNIHPFARSSWLRNDSMKEIGRKTVSLPGEKNQYRIHELDLSDLTKGKSGLYRVTVSAVSGENVIPCDSRTFLLTDVVLQALEDPVGGTIQVYARSIRTGKAPEGGTITVFSRKNQIAAKGKLGTGGGARLSFRPEWDRKDDAVSAVFFRSGNEISYLRLKNKLPLQNEQEIRLPGEIRSLVFTERGICRPGDSFHVFAFLREPAPDGKTTRPLKHAPVRLQVWDPGGALVMDLPEKTDGGGFFRQEIRVPGSVRTGYWNLVCSAAGEEVGNVFIQVADFQPDRIRVTGKVLTPEPDAESPVDFAFDGAYYFGEMLTEGECRWNFRLTPAALPGADPAWTIGTPNDFYAGEPCSGAAVKKEGEVRIRYPGFAAQGGESFTPVRLRAEMTMIEPGGRGVTCSKSVLLHPSERYIGLRGKDSGTRKFSVDAAVFPADGKAFPAGTKQKITFRLARLEWQCVLKQQEGNFRQEWDRTRTPLPEKVLTLEAKADAAGKIRCTPVWNDLSAGEYEVTAISGNARSRLECFHCAGENGVRSADPRKLYFQTDKTLYRPGDAPKITFTSPSSGELFLYSGSACLRSSRVLPVKAGKNTFEVRIPNDLPDSSWYTLCTLATTRNGMPERACGLIRLQVDRKAEHALQVRLDLPEKARPGEKIPVTIRLTNAAGKAERGTVCLYAVDSGVLSVTDYRTPDIYGRFFGSSGFAFSLYDQYGDFFEQLRLTPDGKIGGDGVSARLLRILRQKKTARTVLPSVTVPAGGIAKVTLPLPVHTGEMQVFAVAAGETRAGAVSRKIVLKNPASAELALPAFLAPGDLAEFTVTLFNHDLPEQLFQGELCLPEKILKAEKPSSFQVRLKRGERKVFRFPVRALASGEAAVQIRFRSGKFSASESAFVTVRRPQLPVRKSVLIQLKSGEERNFLPSEEGFARVEEAVLRLSPSPAMSVKDALDFLNQYPYGCLEQTVSGAYPLLVLPELEKADLVPPGQSVNNRKKIESVYSSLLRMMLADGSFAMWPDGREVWLAGSTYALQFLFEAEKKGFIRIDPVRRKLFVKFLRGIAQNTSEQHAFQAARACYALALAGDTFALVPARNLTLLPGRSTSARFLAGAALIHAGYAKTGAEAVRKALKEDLLHQESEDPFAAGKAAHVGMILHVLSELGIPADSVFTEGSVMLAKCIRPDGSGWGTTQENAWAVMGLAAYAGKYPSTDAEVLLNGKKQSLRNLLEQDLGKEGLRVRNISKGILLAEMLLTGIPDKDLPQNDALKLDYQILSGGKSVSSVRHGDPVTIRIRMRSKVKAENAVIALPLPGGLALEDASLATRSAWTKTAEKGNFTLKRLEKRLDRCVIFGDLRSGDSEIVLQARAVCRGTFQFPQAQLEVMYDSSLTGASAGGKILTVK